MQKLFAERMEQIKPSALDELFKHGASPEVISFGGGYPDPELFPLEDTLRVFEHVLTKRGRQALQYATPEGLASLREKIAARMKTAGVNCGADELIILQGGQQGLDLTAKMFLDKGDAVIVEKPTFLGAIASFRMYQPNFVSVEMDEDGLDTTALEEALRKTPRVKFIYTVPEFHNPTGRTMPMERRRRLLELARQYDVLILEDSPYREIRYEGEAAAPIKSLDSEGRVIHLGSFSKILFPGLRLGWAVASPLISEKFAKLKIAADTQCSTLNMHAADVYMELFDLDAHIAGLRDAYRRKKELMLKTIRETFPAGISHTNPQGGLFTWLSLPRNLDTAAIMKERLMPEAKVAYVPGDVFFANEVERNHCRVNYSCMPDEKIIKGISKMGEIFSDYMK